MATADRRYILVADEMGTPGMAYGTSNTYVFGGYVVAEDGLDQAVSAWRQVKQELCGDTDAELKWKHFFVDEDDPSIKMPLRDKEMWMRRRQAARTLDFLFGQASIRPAMLIVRKDRATEALITKSRKGKDKIDDDLIWVVPVAQFGFFLHSHRARGKLWCDSLGSEKQEQRRQTAWSEQLRMVRDREMPDTALVNMQKLLAIDERVEFFDSRDNEAVQISDFVCGVIWAAGEGDESYLRRFLDKYGPSASRQGLGIVHIL